jgi:uncharacterized protein (DUF305 family)
VPIPPLAPEMPITGVCLAYDQPVPFWRFRLLLLAAAAGAALAGCNGTDSLFGGRSHAANGGDASFLRSMTRHETESLGITRLAGRRALRQELRGIARTMTSEQQKELQQLGSLAQGLGSHGVRPPATPPTQSAAMLDLDRVKDATSFDYEFMRTMIEQNQAAIAIAQDEARLGSDPEVKRLAAAIAWSRKKELERIRAWLRLWYGGDIQPGVPAPGPPGGGGGGGQTPGPGAPHPRPGVPL